jgi:hypothetical protein
MWTSKNRRRSRGPERLAAMKTILVPIEPSRLMNSTLETALLRTRRNVSQRSDRWPSRGKPERGNLKKGPLDS